MTTLTGSLWIPVHDGDARAYGMYQRHYSARKNGKRSSNLNITGPGEHLILMTVGSDALFAWVNNTIERADGQEGVNCAVFRNEGSLLSSDLIRDACEWAWDKWPGERLFTYVWDDKIKSVNPGYCYKVAGWQSAGRNKDGRLSILEISP